MPRLSRWIAACAFVLSLSGGAAAQAQEADLVCPARQVLDAAPNLVRSGDPEALAGFRATAPCHHWITFYFAAEHLFAAGEKDEAVRWFYVGQLRGRVVGVLDHGSTPMTIDALQYVVGQPVNEYAGGDLDKWIASANWVLAWDRRHPMRRETIVTLGGPSLDFDPTRQLHLEPLSPPVTQARFDAVYAEQRRGLENLRDMLASVDREEWARRRRENGLD
jgi:hypothetical protein